MGLGRDRIKLPPLGSTPWKATANIGRTIPAQWRAIADAEIGSEIGALIQHNQTGAFALLDGRGAVRPVPDRKVMAALAAAGIELTAGEGDGSGAVSPESLRAWRVRLGLSQADAAAALGVSPRSYQYYETGDRPIPHTLALACAAVEAGLPPIE